MNTNQSPWLRQLKANRASNKLAADIVTDISVIGGGIAGISTAFYLLKHTSARVAMLERYKVAHGATGHNAGQVVSYFERGFASLVDEFGLELATKGQKDVEDAWQLLDEMYTDARLTIPFSRFLGHAGLSSYEQVLLHLKNNAWRKKAGLGNEQLLISADAGFLNIIPSEYSDLYTIAPAKEIMEILETKSDSFIAVLSYQKGCVNSALFCEEVLNYLLEQYSDRFSLYEETPISKILLKGTTALLVGEEHTVTAGKVVLCTNGFTGITIIHESGLEINTKFHHMVYGTIGYMSGYIEPMTKPPTAISYLADPDPNPEDPYFYLTRRMYEYDGKQDLNLISIGGPEHILDDSTRYSHLHEYSEEMVEKIETFRKTIYDSDPDKKIDYLFTWHGLMGYTKNGIRLVGAEPKNPTLLYNLGCNGIGILPSVYGGKRITEIISGTAADTKTIFDVPEEYDK